ncbi:MAG: nuclear transport factor 2 family protein [Lutibacter sp.]|nr:nuclear transport factor 2 family protein [Lutibacter sp.]
MAVIIYLLLDCNTQNNQERSIGFLTAFQDDAWYLGTDEAIQVVSDLDKAWAKRDYEAMRTFLADTATFYFPNGTIVRSADAFIQSIQEGNQNVESSWTYDFAYSVDFRPGEGGEHIQAGFTGTQVKDSVTTRKKYRESYYVVEGKIVEWQQYEMLIKEE